MDIFQFEGSSSLPSIYLDKRNQIFEISGASFPEDSNIFYAPVFRWLEYFENNPETMLLVTFKLDYFNTSSSKVIHNILNIFNRIHVSGTKINAKWLYTDDDEEIYEAGVDFAEKLKFKMELVPVMS